MRKLLYLALILPLTLSCSVGNKLAEGEFRLARNRVRVTGSLPSSEINPYIKQQPSAYYIFDFNPMRPKIAYDRALSEASVENIGNHLSYLGYHHPSITFSEKKKRRRISVTYTVDPGLRTTIDTVIFILPDSGSFREDFLRDTSRVILRRGTPLSEPLLDKEADRVLSRFRNIGYYPLAKTDFRFVADTAGRDGGAVLEYIISPQKAPEKYRFGGITLRREAGLKFRDSILNRYLYIKPGRTYNESMVNRTYSSLSQIHLFNSINIETFPSDSNRVNCDISLSHSEIQGFRVNLEGSVTSTGLVGISPKINYYHRNIFHGGELLNLGFSGDFQSRPGTDTKSTEFTVSSGLGFPFPHLRLDVNAAYNYQDRPEFQRDIYSGSIGFNGKLKRRLNYQIQPIQVNAVYLRHISSDFDSMLEKTPFLRYSYSNHFDAGLGGTLYYSTNSAIVPKTSFASVRLSFDTSGNLISLFGRYLTENADGAREVFNLPFSQYVRADLSLVRNVRFGRDDRLSFAIRANGGVAHAYGNSRTVPFEKQFYVGGSNSMRGWQARSIGPGDAEYMDSFSIPSQTGDVKMELDAEFRFPIVWKLEGALFAELGNVWELDTLDRNFYRDAAADCGIGIRLNLDFIVLRLDGGLQVHDPSRSHREGRWLGPDRWFSDNGYAIHFGVGYPF